MFHETSVPKVVLVNVFIINEAQMASGLAV